MEVEEADLDQLELDFERYRLVDPKAEARMRVSLKTYGQLSPVFVGIFEKKRVLIDGFKRYRAARSLGKKTLRISCVEQSMISLKAIALNIHRESSPLREIEEGLLLYSLHREDGLRQDEIGILCNKHKSWVSRRIALIERLDEEVQQQLRLGLLSVSIARELLRLPRGNQASVLKSILSNALSSRQSRELVTEYQHAPAWQREKLLGDPFKTVEGLVKRIDCGIFSPMVTSLILQSERLYKEIQERGIGALDAAQRCRVAGSLQQVSSRCGAIINLCTDTERNVCR